MISSSSTQPDDAALVGLVIAGDSEAFTELAGRYHSAVCAVAYGYLGNFDDVQDAVQDAFIIAYKRLSSLQEPGKFGPWLRKITANLCLDILRSQRNHLPLDEVTERAGFDDSQALATQSIVWDALTRLSEEKRITTTMFYVDGYSHAEIADFLEVPVNTVRSRLQSAKKQLTEEMITLVKDVLDEGRNSIKISNPRVLQSDLAEYTGNDEIDLFLYGVVNVIGIAFGEQIRSVFLVKAYLYREFLPVAVVFKDGVSKEYRWNTWSMMDHIMHLSKYRYKLDPYYFGGECRLYGEPDSEDQWTPCDSVTQLSLREDSLLLWGEDIRHKIVQPDIELVKKDALIPVFNRIKWRHNDRKKPDDPHPLDTKLTYPLSESDVDVKTSPEDIEHLAFDNLLLARAAVTVDTGSFISELDTVACEYAKQIDGAYASLVQQSSDILFGQLTWQQKRKAVSSWRRLLTGFENSLLEIVFEKGLDISDHVIRT